MARSNSAGLVKSFQLVTDGPHQIERVWADNSGAAVAYLMLFDTASTPAESSVPDFERAVGIAQSAEINFFESGQRFEKGLFAVLSSTPGVLTTVGTAIGWFQTIYH